MCPLHHFAVEYAMNPWIDTSARGWTRRRRRNSATAQFTLPQRPSCAREAPVWGVTVWAAAVREDEGYERRNPHCTAG